MTNSSNKETARVGTYLVDFDKKTASAKSDVNVHAAFKSIGAIAAQTEPPVVTTHPPVQHTTKPAPTHTTAEPPQPTEPAQETEPVGDPNADQD